MNENLISNIKVCARTELDPDIEQGDSIHLGGLNQQDLLASYVKEKRIQNERNRKKHQSLKTRDRRLNIKPRSKSICSPGVLMTKRGEMIVVDIMEDDETEVEEFAYRGGTSTGDVEKSVELTQSSIYEMEEMSREADRQQKRATVMVTSGALTFILLAAAMITTSFLISPVIEDIFGKK